MSEQAAAVPPVDAALARRIEAADAEYVAARLEWFAALPGNPLRASARRVGGALVLRAPGVRSSMFNRILLADDALLPHLDAAIAAAGGPMASGRVDVVPPLPCARLLPALTRRGYACAAHFSALYAVPGGAPPERPFHGTVRKLREGELEAWTEVYLRAFGFGGAHAESMGGSLGALADRSEAVLLLAELDGRMAATTALWLQGAVAYVALCATLPEASGRGCQTTLLQAAAVIAAERGCDLLGAHAAVGSRSQRNFERAGWRLAFHKGLWTRPPV